MNLNEQVVDTWGIHHQMLLYVLDAIEPEHLPSVPGSKGRSVAQIFAHVHNTRLMWLNVSAPTLAAGLAKIETRSKADQAAITKDMLRQSLEGSSQAMETLLRQGLEKGKIKDARPHVMGFFGYMLAHEWYHISEISMTLTIAGHPLKDEILYEIWEWGKR